MSTTRRRKPTRKSAPARRRKTAKATSAATQRKKEILGMLLLALAFLLLLAVVSYHPDDNALARSFTFESLLDPNVRAHNALGQIGALVAFWLVPSFLGYLSLGAIGLLFVVGYLVFRNRSLAQVRWLAWTTLGGILLLAIVIGWMTHAFDWQNHDLSGAFGYNMAGWLRRILGPTGAFAVLLLTILVALRLFIDRDIQRSLDRVEDGLKWLKDKAVSTWQSFKTNRADRKKVPKETPVAPPTTPPPSPTPTPDHTETWTPVAEAPRPPTTPVPAPPTFPPPATPDPTITPVAPLEPSHPTSDEPAFQIQDRVEEQTANLDARRGGGLLRRKPYQFPSIDLLSAGDPNAQSINYAEIETNKQILLDKLDTYNIQITNINAVVGPTVTLYELTPAPGVKISRVKALEDDLAMALAARGIRMIAPIPGKSAIGVEIPNQHRELVHIRDLLNTARFRDSQMALPIAIGKTIEGKAFIEDLTKMPHLLVAGATGSGKSVGINTLIVSLLYACDPADLKFVMIDPKKIELQLYAQIADHYLATPPLADAVIITDFMQALGVLKSCEKEMERRYDLLSDAAVRDLKGYNKKVKTGTLDPAKGHRHLPYLVVVVDELADLMMTAGKEIEGPIARLAQMARAVGIHLVLATQRPSVDVITGLIKANFPARIAYQVASKIDSRTILDQSGADQLVGNGDLLYMNGSQIVRLQGAFTSLEEVENVNIFIGDQDGSGPYELPPIETPEEANLSNTAAQERDPLFGDAARIIVRHQQGSVSLLQRKLSIGYARAGRIVEQLEQAGIVGPFVGSKARTVLIPDELELDTLLSNP